MKKSSLKILLLVVGVLLMVVSVLFFDSVLAGIGIGIGGILMFGGLFWIIKSIFKNN
jgi:hypothetical protein